MARLRTRKNTPRLRRERTRRQANQAFAEVARRMSGKRAGVARQLAKDLQALVIVLED